MKRNPSIPVYVMGFGSIHKISDKYSHAYDSSDCVVKGVKTDPSGVLELAFVSEDGKIRDMNIEFSNQESKLLQMVFGVVRPLRLDSEGFMDRKLKVIYDKFNSGEIKFLVPIEKPAKYMLEFMYDNIARKPKFGIKGRVDFAWDGKHPEVTNL